jgi:hypothetical protein
VERLEPAALGGAEVRRKREARERGEGVLDLLELPLEREGARREGRGALRVGPHDLERIAQERPALALGRDPERVHQHERVAGLEVVALDRRDEALLVLRRDRAESVGERGADRAVGELPLDPG